MKSHQSKPKLSSDRPARKAALEESAGAAAAIEAAKQAEERALELCMAEPLDSPELARLRREHIKALNAYVALTEGD